MRFISATETRVAGALDDANVLYFPLPVAVRHRVKFEVDFLVVHRGRVGVLEVDGPTHTATTRAREDSRAAWFEKSGIALFRHYPASAVDDGPAAVVADFLNDLRGPRL
jgi:very-short-patch-repair endonuclease